MTEVTPCNILAKCIVASPTANTIMMAGEQLAVMSVESKHDTQRMIQDSFGPGAEKK